MTALSLFWSKYRQLFKVEWAVLLAYRGESVIYMIGAFVQPLVGLAVWLSVSGGGSRMMNGYGAREYVLYFLGVLLVDRLTSTWDVWDVDASIRDGTMSAKLLRPFHPIHASLAQNLVYKLFFAALLVPAWVALALAFPPLRPPVGLGSYTLFVVSLLLSSAIRFAIGYEFGMLAFWTNRATGLYALYEGVHLFLAGRLAPLSMFPEWVERCALWLPFYNTVGFPVELLTGALNGRPELIVRGLALQTGWLVVFVLLFRFMWRRGLKRYGAVGG
jgi:ABC-2 type transport system permease protein